MGGRLFASDRTGFIKGKHSATCFMDVPFASLKYVLNSRDSNPAHPRYEPYGIVISKKVAYSKGCRPVLYLSKSEIKQLEIIEEEHWRIVDFEAKNDRWISWLHEREWRCRGDFKVPPNLYCVLVKNADEAQRLQNKIVRNPKLYKIKPRSIVPLTVICQGLTIR